MSRSSLILCLGSFLTLCACGDAADSGDDAQTSALSDETGFEVETGIGDESGEGESESDATSGAETDTGTSDDGDSDTDAGSDTETDTGNGDTGGGDLDPPAGMSSGGSGGPTANGDYFEADGINFRLITGSGSGPHPLMVVYSGVEGGAAMTNNILMVKNQLGWSTWVVAVLDGTDYYGDGDAGAFILDTMRDSYDIDNDRTYLLSESAGTTAGLELGFDLRPSYFAAFWANDVNASSSPSQSAEQLGFAPWGNAGPGGNYAEANAIVSGMQSAGYRFDGSSPYDGPGAGTHGDSNQFLAALQWFAGKSRQ